MGSTSLAELYFRSLKTGKVLNQLTKYLLQYKRVSIPSVGTIQLVQQPPQLNVVDKVILPPSYSVEIIEEEAIPEHQLNFLSSVLGEDKEAILHSLRDLGHKLKERMQGGGFDWKGIGILRKSSQAFAISTQALEPVPAERVLRQGAGHQVLVGDQQMTSIQITGLREEEGKVAPKQKRSVLIIVGWILLFLSILFIVFILYNGKFRIGATGSKQSPTSLNFFQSPPFQSAKSND